VIPYVLRRDGWDSHGNHVWFICFLASFSVTSR